jgi:hypothetical protein
VEQGRHGPDRRHPRWHGDSRRPQPQWGTRASRTGGKTTAETARTETRLTSSAEQGKETETAATNSAGLRKDGGADAKAPRRTLRGASTFSLL